MTRKKPTHPNINPLFLVAPGEVVTYWPLEGIVEDRHAMFKAARKAAEAGHVSLHCVGDTYVAVGRER